MRFVGLALIALSLPIFWAWLQSSARNRDHALMLLGALILAGGALKSDVSIISWPLWPGTSKGVIVGFGDTLALAILFTRRHRIGMLPFTGLVVAYLAVMVLATAYSRMPMASLFPTWDMSRALIVFLAVGGELLRPSAYSALLRGFAIALMVQAGFVVKQKLSGVVQATGTMDHQNLLGMSTILVFLPLLAAMLERDRHILIKLGLIGGAIVIAGGGSRATLAAAGVGSVMLIMVSLVRHTSSRKAAMAGVAALMIVASAPFAWMTLNDRFGSSNFKTDEELRGAMNVAAADIASKNIFGVGSNLYVTVANTEGYNYRAGVNWYSLNRAAPVHNAYRLARAEIGYHGQLLLVLLFAVPMIAGLRQAYRNRKSAQDGMLLGPVAALAAVAWQSNYEFAIALPKPQTLMMTCLAIIAARILASKAEMAAARASRLPEPETCAPVIAPGLPSLPRIPGRS